MIKDTPRRKATSMNSSTIMHLKSNCVILLYLYVLLQQFTTRARNHLQTRAAEAEDHSLFISVLQIILHLLIYMSNIQFHEIFSKLISHFKYK